jgi:hypothetical protein
MPFTIADFPHLRVAVATPFAYRPAGDRFTGNGVPVFGLTAPGFGHAAG